MAAPPSNCGGIDKFVDKISKIVDRYVNVSSNWRDSVSGIHVGRNGEKTYCRVCGSEMIMVAYGKADNLLTGQRGGLFDRVTVEYYVCLKCRKLVAIAYLSDKEVLSITLGKITDEIVSSILASKIKE